MQELVEEVEAVKFQIGERVKKRIKEFKEIGRNKKSIKNELCFCLLTANYDAAKAIKIQEELRDDFFLLSSDALSQRLKALGYRYPNKRSEYIVACRRCSVTKQLKLPEQELREWLVRNVKGLGFKESSHFMRNIGFENVAIIDFHIIDILERYGLIEKPKTLTKKNYLYIESVLNELAQKCSVTLADLDLYLWYLETGKLLK
jgi:N-glycosylase/DNA lyase